MIVKLLPFAFLMVLTVSCAYAWRCGGRDERSVAVYAVVAATLSLVAALRLGRQWQSPEYALLAVDVAFLAVLLAIALKSDRYWPLWACAFQLVAVVTHIAVIVDPRMLPRAYSLAQPFWAYPLLASLALGTWNRSRLSSAAAATS